MIRPFLACALGSMIGALAQDARGQEKAPAQILIGAGLGRRQSPRVAGTDYGHAALLRVSIRSGTERLLVFEPELGYWQETKVALRDNPVRELRITTRLLSAGLNLLLHPRVGPIHFRAGGGAGAVYHHDDGDSSGSEVLLGLNLQLGAELDVADRIGVFGVIRGEAVGTGSLAVVYGGLRIRI